MTADLMTGMFRGICVDNKDPKNLGRIRVQVPQILGIAASGWAFPSWSFYQKTIWPQDRLPKPGDGVWVMFDSTSPDKMIWMAAFGPLELIQQPEFIEMPDYKSTLTMEPLSVPPRWNVVSTFTGKLNSDAGGVPNPNAVVQLSARTAGGAWSLISEDPVDPNGDWMITHTVTRTGNVEYRASFNGTGVYGPVSSAIASYYVTPVSFPTSLTLSSQTASPAFGAKITLGGKLTTGGSPPSGYTVPKPNAKVNVYARASGTTPWTAAISNAPVDPATGNWSGDYTIAIAGLVEYQATFATMDIYTGSSSTILSINTSVGTSVSTPVLPTMTYGSSFSAAGTIKVAATGANVTAGTAELWWRYTTGGNTTTWTKVASQTITAGTYSLTAPALTIVGPTSWQVRYTGTSNFNAANSDEVAGSVGLPAMGTLAKGTVSHTSAAFSWTAVSGATYYSVEKYVSSVWTVVSTQTGTSYSDTGLSNDSTYYWRVRPRATDQGSAYVYGSYSAQIQLNTGHPAVTVAAGTSGWISIDTNTFRCHRNDSTGWGDSGDYEMRQGYYSSPYGGEGYIGIAKFTGSTIRDTIISALGTDGSLKQSNGTCNACQITLYRTTTGTDTSATFKFYTTTSQGTGARPTLQGTAVSIAASGYSTSKTYNIGTAHGQRLGDGGANSVAIANNSANQYAALNGSGTNGGKLEIKWTWGTITKTALVAAAWA